ncbi:hypothetical protein HKBW3S25_01910 [Candidatus Hakubella thermalkaliphila]|uniref:Uncharacterized protein n=1 Tax=Candidatus Hakubella thermalkaliphila TaxID=2754717 RepID=A0A6V8P1X0_9ACTN|nr:hypothetical protein HKBW3S25_01910 [Candidatus Hakubella thermalkaliphila]
MSKVPKETISHHMPEEHVAPLSGEARSIDHLSLPFQDGAEQASVVLGIILQICILDEEIVPAGRGKASAQGRSLASIARGVENLEPVFLLSLRSAGMRMDGLPISIKNTFFPLHFVLSV